MVSLIFLIVAVAVIAGAILIGFRRTLDEDPRTQTGVGGKTFAVIGTLIGLAVLFVGFGFREIGPGQVGVKTQFGQVQEGTLSPGLQWLIPGVQEITIFDGRVQAYNFESIEGATKDLQAVGLSGLINFHIDAEKADRILQEIGGPSEYAQKVFLRPSNTALKEITPRFDASDVVAKRDEIGQLTLENLQERMAEFHIIVDRVSVENIGLAQAFLDSVEAKQIAEQDLFRADFERQTAVKLAEGKRDAQVTEAKGDRDSRILRAEGEAQANDLINESLTDQLLQWASIQKFNDKVQVMLVPSDQGFIIDLKGLQEEQQP